MKCFNGKVAACIMFSNTFERLKLSTDCLSLQISGATLHSSRCGSGPLFVVL
jgi:hypothetical protein